MRRDTLLDFFEDLSAHRGAFLVYDDGYRSRTFGYREVAAAARRFAETLRETGLVMGDKVIVWGENRPEWIVALWGCLLEGVVVVPIDYRASAEMLDRVRRIVAARLILIGDDVQLASAEGAKVWKLDDLEWPAMARVSAPPRSAGAAVVSKDDVAEIIFTSGATADPKGVVITHRNVLANIVPVEREVLEYRKYGRPFFPLRFLNLLPLSHMFGQAMATFIPPMLPGIVVFMRGYNPAEIVRQVHSRRVSVLVCVPKILDVLREHVLRHVPESGTAPPPGTHWLKRWWFYRKVHRLFGWKFWAFVVGAAPLDPDLEEFWSRLGFVVIQGYGLTEAAPIVTLNHPFKTRKGSVGTPIAGVEVKIAPDGEILVRGENVTKGYFNAQEETNDAFQDGWFHTGDLGSTDEEGRLSVRGRKKEVIVTPEGLNVFPEDVERTLNAIGGVRDSAVVGRLQGREERVHAVLVLEGGKDADEIVRTANAMLEDHQKIRGFTVWRDAELPRTEGTRKLKRAEIRRTVERGATALPPSAPAGSASIEAIVARYGGARTIAPGTTLDELGLSSLERLELMMALEERFQTTIDEGAFSGARDVAALRALIERPAAAATPAEPLTFPSWNRSGIARAVRRSSLPTWILPIARVFAWIRTDGLEHLRALEGPAIFAANHQSHMDGPVILAALPPRWRYRIAPAMAKEFFKAHFFPEQHSRRQWITNSLNYYLAALFFNAFPLPQREAGTRQTLRYAGELLGAGYSILIFPEGRRSETGDIERFQPGVGMMAAKLDVPVVPVRIVGLDKVLHMSWKMARPGPVRVTFGAPLRLQGEDYAALARQVEEAVRNL